MLGWSGYVRDFLNSECQLSVVRVSELEYVHLPSTLAEWSLTLAALLLALGICIGAPVFGSSTARRFPAMIARGSYSVLNSVASIYDAPTACTRLRDERRNGASKAIVVKVTIRSRGRKHTLSGSC
jgi:hypothetical protein